MKAIEVQVDRLIGSGQQLQGKFPPPPVPPGLSGQQLQGLAGKQIVPLAGGGNISRPTCSPTPCPRCRGKGWVFVSILDGATKRCGCEERF